MPWRPRFGPSASSTGADVNADLGVEILYLVRHGKAVASHPEGDRHRPLSAEGLARIASMKPQADALGFRADLALSSPYVRAVQTRDLFAPVVQSSRSATSRAFTPDSDPEEAFAELLAWESDGARRIAVFTHNPFVTELASWLLAGGLQKDIVFHTPTILALHFDQGLAQGKGRPLWTLHP